MAVATRSAIQKEVFSPLEERLVAIVNVTKPGRKKKSSFLCLSGEICVVYRAKDIVGCIIYLVSQ